MLCSPLDPVHIPNLVLVTKVEELLQSGEESTGIENYLVHSLFKMPNSPLTPAVSMPPVVWMLTLELKHH